MNEQQEIFRQLLARGVVVEGHFLLKSGNCSSHYLCVEKLLDDQLAYLTGKLIERMDLYNTQVFIGLKTGGKIVLEELRFQIAIQEVFKNKPKPRFITVSKNGVGKFFLTKRQKEIVSAKNVTLVDDVMTAGTAIVEVSQLLSEERVGELRVAVLVDRQKPGHKLPIDFKEMASGYQLVVPNWTKETCLLCRKKIPWDKVYGYGHLCL